MRELVYVLSGVDAGVGGGGPERVGESGAQGNVLEEGIERVLGD